MECDIIDRDTSSYLDQGKVWYGHESMKVKWDAVMPIDSPLTE